MTRDEELQQQAMSLIGFSKEVSREDAIKLAYYYGAKYADATMLDHACEWLELRMSEDFPVDTDECGMPFCESWIKAQEERIKAMKEFITAFRQAMEGE